MNKFILIDGNSLLFRAFYANYSKDSYVMQTSKGEYTNAIFSFSKMLNKIIQKYQPKYLAVSFDKGKKTFRNELYNEYKDGRKETPKELINQFQLVRELLKSYNIKYLELDGYEADDIIGSLANKFNKENIYILTSDKDMLQLINNSTKVIIINKGISETVIVDNVNIEELYGFKADQVVDYKSLCGDKSDNIKGVTGIGDIKAKKLLQEYGSLISIYNNINDIKGKTKEYLINDKENAFLSYTLATIKKDIDIDCDLQDFILNINVDKLKEFYKDFEMKSLYDEDLSFLNNKNHENKQNNDFDFKVVENFSKHLLEKDLYVYFYTNDFDYYDNKIIATSISDGENIEVILGENFLNDQNFINYLGSNKNKVTINLKNILHILNKKGIAINNFDDFLLISFILDNRLDEIDKVFLAYNCDTFSKIDLVGSVKRPKEISLDVLFKHLKILHHNLKAIYPSILAKLKESNLISLYKEIELPLLHILKNMEEIGIRVDVDKLDEISRNLANKLELLTKEIYELSGKEFNINSPKQLAEILFDELGLKENKKRSTSIEVLESLELTHPIITPLIEYRKYSKIYSTYSEGFKKYIKKDGKIHTIFSQTTAATGRLSSYDPGIQNISIKSNEGKEVRKAFIASEGCKIISSDYSQIELRILAHMAKEEKMIKAYNSDEDIHTKTAMEMFNLRKEEVDSMHRRKAKAINFGVIYGISEFGLVKQTQLSFTEAKAYIDMYFIKYPKIREFMDYNYQFLLSNGYVNTILNRRRYIDEINSNSYFVREFAKRASFNSPIQGSGADIIKLSMIKIDKMIKDKKLKSKMILQVHDELVFEVLDEEVDIMCEVIKKGMEEAIELSVPLKCEIHISDSLDVK